MGYAYHSCSDSTCYTGLVRRLLQSYYSMMCEAKSVATGFVDAYQQACGAEHLHSEPWHWRQPPMPVEASRHFLHLVCSAGLLCAVLCVPESTSEAL